MMSIFGLKRQKMAEMGRQAGLDYWESEEFASLSMLPVTRATREDSERWHELLNKTIANRKARGGGHHA